MSEDTLWCKGHSELTASSKGEITAVTAVYMYLLAARQAQPMHAGCFYGAVAGASVVVLSLTSIGECPLAPAADQFLHCLKKSTK